MKWALLIAVLAAAWPLGRVLRARLRAQEWILWLMGFLPFIGLPHVTMNPISYERYRGDARGLEVTLVDILALVLLFALPPRRHPVPFWRTNLLYLAAVAVSISAAPMPHYAFFGLWKALRLFLYVVVMARAFENAEHAARWLKGIGWGSLYALIVALQQRYLLHQYQIPSTFPHQNTLGMAIALIAPVIFAILLAGHGGRLAWASLVTMSVLIVMGLSRGAMVAFLLSMGGVYALSLTRGWTRRKALVAASAVAGGALLLAKSYQTIADRFLHAPESSRLARLYFEQAAARMLEDHPFGIGVNQFSHVLQHSGYARTFAIEDQSGLVHNLYWLTLSELGYVGFAVFVLLLATPLVIALRGAWRARGDIRGDLLVGCSAGMLAMYAQSFLEWVARQTVMGYLYWGVAALAYAYSREVAAVRSRRAEPDIARTELVSGREAA